jgi:hypothetical protein
MARALIERYDDRIAGVLSCYDRVVVTGDVVQNQPILGYTDVQKRPACKSRISVGRWSLQEACSSSPPDQAC